MLYETLSQPKIFALIVLAGFLSGFLFDFKQILLSVFKKNKILNHILSFFALFFVIFSFFLTNLKINYGEIRFFTIFSFYLSFSIQRFISQNFLAKQIAKCYNKYKGKTNGKRKDKVERT